jgi:hypothetical protein
MRTQNLVLLVKVIVGWYKTQPIDHASQAQPCIGSVPEAAETSASAQLRRGDGDA